MVKMREIQEPCCLFHQRLQYYSPKFDQNFRRSAVALTAVRLAWRRRAFSFLAVLEASTTVLHLGGMIPRIIPFSLGPVRAHRKNNSGMSIF